MFDALTQSLVQMLKFDFFQTLKFSSKSLMTWRVAFFPYLWRNCTYNFLYPRCLHLLINNLEHLEQHFFPYYTNTHTNCCVILNFCHTRHRDGNSKFIVRNRKYEGNVNTFHVLLCLISSRISFVWILNSNL